MGKGIELLHTAETSFISDIKRIVEEGRRAAYGAVNTIMIETYWQISRRIVEQEQNGQFYLIAPDIKIWKSRFPNLTWTHIFRTSRVEQKELYKLQHKE